MIASEQFSFDFNYLYTVGKLIILGVIKQGLLTVMYIQMSKYGSRH